MVDGSFKGQPAERRKEQRRVGGNIPTPLPPWLGPAGQPIRSYALDGQRAVNLAYPRSPCLRQRDEGEEPPAAARERMLMGLALVF
jgi:hypothetical protein